MLRRKPKADPLVARKKPQVRPPSARSTSVLSGENRNGITSLSLPSEARTVNLTSTEDEAKKVAAFEAQRSLNGGWTDPAPTTAFRDFPVVTTKRALREGIRYHVMRFAKGGKGGEVDREIDPTNQEDFTRPVSLHRRDPRQPAPGRVVKEQPSPSPAATADEKEAEKIALQKAEREAQRAMDMAQIAPVAKETNAKKPPPNQKKEKQFQFYFPKNTAEQKKESEIRYEEALPWHLEDADGKNVWVGTYISALSEANVALVISGSAFRMVPLEKFYRFTPKPPFQAYSIEQAEEIMGKKMSVGRWAMRDTEKKKQAEELEETRRIIGGRSRVKQESSTFRSAPRSEKMEHDDIDMEGDEFQDDDENTGLEPDNDEDSKDTRERLRRNHLGANLFGDADEQEVDKEEQENKAEKKTRQLGKHLRKALAKREDHLEYLEYVDSDTNSEKEDFLDLSSDDEEDEDEKKDEDAKAKADGKDGKDGKDKSGATPKGSTTPSGKQRAAEAKAAEASKKGKSLKRPGSPNLSESSGNESSRKKVKKHAAHSVRPSRSTTPMPGQAAARGMAKGGALSDGEGTAGEMSDGAGGSSSKNRIKFVKKTGGTGAAGTPTGSRATSPNPNPNAQGLGPGASASPRSPPRAASPNGGKVDAAEIVNMLVSMPEGISVSGLLRMFGNRVGEGPNQMSRKDWIKLVKDNAIFCEDKLLRPRAPKADA